MYSEASGLFSILCLSVHSECFKSTAGEISFRLKRGKPEYKFNRGDSRFPTLKRNTFSASVQTQWNSL